MRATGHRLLVCLSCVARARLLGDARGDVAVEYVALIATIALPAIAAFVAVGKAIVHNYTVLQNVLIAPLP